MRLEPITVGATRVSRWSAIALGASLPVSTALDNILLVLILTAWALSGQARQTIIIFFKNKHLRYTVLLFALLALGTLYGESPRREALATLGKYADLLCIPVFAMAFRQHDTRIKALHAFALSLALIVLLSYLIRWNLLPALPFITGDTASPTVFKQKITHSILLAFGAFLFVWLGSISASPKLRVVWYSLSALAVLNVIFVVQGATGYLTLGALIVLLIWARLGWRGTAYGALGLIAIFAVLAVVPSPFQERVTRTQQEIQQWHAGEASATDSSAGLRLEFYHNTLAIIAAHPLTGVGTGGFSRAYAKHVEGSGRVATHNPHNEFLHITVQIGILGLAALLLMLWQQWRTAKQLNVPIEQALMQALVLTFVTGSLINSLLLDHAEGLFYAWLSGLLYGGLSGIKYGLPEKTSTQT